VITYLTEISLSDIMKDLFKSHYKSTPLSRIVVCHWARALGCNHVMRVRSANMKTHVVTGMQYCKPVDSPYILYGTTARVDDAMGLETAPMSMPCDLR
jgi:hypothetical protein